MKDRSFAGRDGLPRRGFLARSVGAAALLAVPRAVIGGPGQTPPSDKLGIAGVGIGGRGSGDIASVASENIVALCDVDQTYASAAFNAHPKARKHRDFRKMLDEQKDIDAVVIATPDHLHAVIAMAAMKLGKHVYVEKPMAHTVFEARALAEAARTHKVATQMGNQGNAGEGVRLIEEWIADGAIGTVREVQAWTNKPIWPQGVERPTEKPPVPATLDWDLWLGPAPAPITPPTCRSSGAAGGTSVAARWATWAATFSITRSARSSSAIRRASRHIPRK